MHTISLSTQQPPELLYHYTSFQGMLGILSDGAVWATETRYFNDAKELANTLDFVDAEASRCISTATNDEVEVINQFREWMNTRVRSGHPMLFVVSLTENGNLLSQWRGYTPKGSGVSLGFTSDKLMLLAANQGYRLARCIYNIEEQRNVVRKILGNLLKSASIFDRTLGHNYPPNQVYSPLFESLEEELFFVATLLKHHSFKEEAEWRLVSKIVRQPYITTIDFRAGTSSLIPYTNFNLKDETGLTIPRTAFVGPTPNMELAMHAVGMAISRYVQGGNTVLNSFVPLRDM